MLTGKQLSKLYPYTLSSFEVTSEAISRATLGYKDALLKMASKREEPIYLRPSLLGKAAIDVVARKFFPSKYANWVSEARIYQVFHDGNVFECDYIFQIECNGVTILSVQPEIEFYGICGHADVIVMIDGKSVLLELKTSNDGYFEILKKMQHNDGRQQRFGVEYTEAEHLCHRFTDFRGHLTQAAFYHSALGVDESVIVVKDKSSSRLCLYNLTEQDIKTQTQRSVNIINAWNKVNSWEEAFVYCGIPQPTRSTAKDRKGQFLLPAKLYGSPIIDLIYETYVDAKGRMSVTGYRLPEEAIPLLPKEILSEYDKLGIYAYSAKELQYG